MKSRALRLASLMLTIGLVPVGCGPTSVDTTYGRSRGSSINGTGAFAEVLRQQGHEVRAALRATETLANWANVIVRFSGHPGPPDQKEARWLFDWLMAGPGRKVVYIPRDFDAEPEFWEAMLAAQPQGTGPEVLDRVGKKRDAARSWVANLPPKAKEPARSADWFAVDPKPSAPAPCQTLEGPWAVEVDAARAAVSKHEGLKAEGDEVPLLIGDGSPLALTWSFDNGSQVLAIANASFLLNASLLNRARRPLAMRVAGWIGPDPAHVAFVEGNRALDGSADPASSSPFHLFAVQPFGWVAAHLLVFLLLLALSVAVRLGRPLPEPPSGAERPSAHPEALGALLARTGRADAARFLLEAYRRWRHPSHVAGRSAPDHPPSPRVPRR